MLNNAHSPEEESVKSESALNNNEMENATQTREPENATVPENLNDVQIINPDANPVDSAEQYGDKHVSQEVENPMESSENNKDIISSGTIKTAASEPNAEHLTETVSTEEQFLQSHAEQPHDDHEHDEIVTINYSELNKAELISHFEQLLQEENILATKSRAYAIRDAFNQILSHERHQAMEKQTDAGGSKENFEMPLDQEALAFTTLYDKYKQLRTRQTEQFEKQKLDNLKAKETILEKLKKLIQEEENMQRAYSGFNELQSQWRAIGSVPGSLVHDLHMNYKLWVDKFYSLVRINKELQTLDHKKNLEEKIHICDLAEKLLLEPNINKAVAQIRVYMTHWRETGLVPRDKQIEIWDRFKSSVDKIFEKRREFEAQMQTQFEANLAAKQALVLKAEELVAKTYDRHNLWQEALKQANELQAQFKSIGFAPRKENETVWNRFKSALDNFYRAKNDFYQQRKKELSANLQLKTELCIQAEALKESTDWKNTAAQLIQLQEQWKKIGPVSEKHSQKIWQRFKNACDVFFNNRKSHFGNIEKEYDDNLNAKIQLIEKIEQYQMTDNNSENLENFKAFQRQFTDIGLVPMSKKNEVYQRFRSAIDALYNKLSMDEREKARIRYDEKIESIKSHPDSKTKLKDEHYTLQNKIKELTGEVNVWQNNIGFFGRSKGAEVIRKEFEEKIKKAQDQIDTLKQKLQAIKNAG